MAGKRIGGIEGDVIVTGGIVIGLVLVGNSIFNNLTKDQTVANQEALPASSNAFSPQFQAFQDLMTQQGVDAVSTSQSAQADYNSLGPAPALNFSGNGTNVDLNQMLATAAERLYSDTSFFSWDGADIRNVFANFTAKDQVAAAAAYINAIYGADLWQRLTAKIFGFGGLSSADIDLIVNQVNNLPDTL